MTVGVAGLGLIGGSFALAAAKKTPHRVLGFNRNKDTLEEALLCGAIEAELNEYNLPECDIVIVALPPQATVAWVESYGKYLKSSCVLVDAVGVKRVIVEKLSAAADKYGFTYVGGHPMAGKEVAGFPNSDENLYRGASMILTPRTGTDIAIVDDLRLFFLSLGFGRVTIATPEEHDKVIAYTSQLAHIASSAYIKSPSAQVHSGFSAGSFRDLTRVARLDENLWTELFRDNRDYLTLELKELIAHLNEYLDALESENWDEMRALLKDGREKKESSGRA